MGVLPARIGFGRLPEVAWPIWAGAHYTSVGCCPMGNDLGPAGGSHVSPALGRPSPVPPKWVGQRSAVGMVTKRHDVSGVAGPIAAGMTQAITSMVPTPQCGHLSKDCPVSASKRCR